MRAFDDLLRESQTREERARELQREGISALPDAVRDVVDAHRTWFADCMAVLSPDLREKFRGEYEGGTFSPKIKSYLNDPDAPNALWKPLPAENLPGLSRRLTDIVHPLAHRRKGKQAYVIENESDLQDVVHALLLARFADVRAEERGPSQSGGSSTIDFLVKVERIAFETKMTRTTLGAKDVGDEILADIERYRRHPDVDALAVLVYDPHRHIGNSAPLEIDLSRDHDGLKVEVWVAR